MAAHECRVCGNSVNNEHYQAREMLIGLGDVFTYLKCNDCGCLQLHDIPDDLDRYNPTHTPLLRMKDNPLRAIKKRMRSSYYLTGKSHLGRLLARRRVPERFTWFRKAEINLDSKILEVGCRHGRLLLKMRREGFRNLTGIDQHIQHEVAYHGLTIRKQRFEDFQGEGYDFILLDHCFEHLTNPQEVLAKLHSLLKPGRLILIRMPVIDTYAWRSYKTDWVQLNAPRHVFVHSVKSMKRLIEQSKFNLEDTVFDSTELQFFGSEERRYGIPTLGPKSWCSNPAESIFSPCLIEDYRSRAAELNEEGDGDQACFYLRSQT